jgi:hypothetical protein
MTDTAKLQQKAFRDYWAKCKLHHEAFLSMLREAANDQARTRAVDAYLKVTQPSYDEYYAYLKEIGHSHFKSGDD